MIRKFLEKAVQYSNFLSKYQYLRSTTARTSQLFNTPDTKFNIKSPMDSALSMEYDEEFRSRAHIICSDNLGGAWSKVCPDELSLLPISGGMSNLLFCCTLPESIATVDGEPSQVLLRLYGDQSRNDLSIQLQIFKLLSSKDLGPKLYGSFEEGRLEEFLPAESLTSEEIVNHEVSFIVAKKLAAVHCLDVPIDKANTWILDRYNEWIDFIREQGEISSLFKEETRQSTIDMAEELLATDFRKEMLFLRDVFDNTNSPLVFSHNDLHQGNILLAKYSKRRPILEERIVFIDFEYCSYNYRAFDIANHFCEWCFQYDTQEYPHFIFSEERFPSEDVQRNFMRHYLSQLKLLSNQANDPHVILSKNGTRDDNINGNYNNHCIGNRSPFVNGHVRNGHTNNNNNNYDLDKEVDALFKEVQPFFMASNLFWTLWGIKSALTSTINFGYWEHAMTRWRLYSKFKISYTNELKNQENGRNSITQN